MFLVGAGEHPEHGPVADRSSARVLIVDDSALGRECLAIRLSSHYSGIRCAWDLPSVLREVNAVGTPNVVLLDADTYDCAKLLQFSLDLEPKPQVIVFGLSDDRDVIRCAEFGADGLHLRSESLEHLVELMRAVAHGHSHCSPEVSAILVGSVYAAVAGDTLPDLVTEPLTARETEILILLEQGMTNQQIASQLSVTVHTVKNHVHNLLNKLGVRSRAEASRLSRTLKYAGAGGVTPNGRSLTG